MNRIPVTVIAALILVLTVLSLARCNAAEKARAPSEATPSASPPQPEVSKELTRSEAERLIRASKHFPEVVTVKVRVGNLSKCDGGPNPTAAYVAAGLEEISNEQRSADTFHLICPGNSFISYSAAVTELGKPYLIDEPGLTQRDRQIRGISGGEYVLAHACDREFYQITGVKSEGATAVAEYTTRLVHPTPFAGDDCRGGAVKSEQERFQKWDDGWRIVK